MKHLLLLFALTVFSVKAQPTEFYEVPFSCSVKPGLGCGSLAKPVLINLAKHPKIKEAWMNYSGTVMAIIWKKSVDTKRKEAIFKDAFQEWGIIPELINTEKKGSLLKSFQSKEGWYKEEQVDMLSFEEAEEYADILIEILQSKEWIKEKDIKPLRNEMADYFKKEVLIDRDSDPHERWAKEVKDMMKRYVEVEKIDSITLWGKY